MPARIFTNTSSNPMEPIIEAREITKRYRKASVVDGASIRVLPGQIIGLIGPNGAGKTTLLRLLSGLVVPDSGEISYYGQKKGKGFESAKSKIAVTADGPSLYPLLSAKDNIKAYALGRGFPISDDEVEDALRCVGLEPGKKVARNFSMGMKQRLSIAMALSGGCEAILLDEPFNGLDPMGLKQIVTLIRRINAERGIAFLISSHNLPELEGLCESFVFLEKGKVKKALSKDELKKKERRIVSFLAKDAEGCRRLLSESSLSFERKEGFFRVDCDGDPLGLVDSLRRGGVEISDLSIEREGLLSVYSEGRAYDE